MQRLDKILCSQGILSRRDASKKIRSGAVTVDGAVCRTPDQKVDPTAHTIAVDGVPLIYREHVYLMLNKPSGILCVSRDPKAKTVVDLVPPSLRRSGLFPAGRLDKDTRGLVLLTDDGDLAHRLLSPKQEVFKQYAVTVDGPLDATAVRAFADGVTLGDGTPCRPAMLTVTKPDGNAEALVEICEGRFHQIKRMFRSIGRTVVSLERLRIGGLYLDTALPRGACRELTEQELASLFPKSG